MRGAEEKKDQFWVAYQQLYGATYPVSLYIYLVELNRQARRLILR